jgi:hypothetical protein
MCFAATDGQSPANPLETISSFTWVNAFANVYEASCNRSENPPEMPNVVLPSDVSQKYMKLLMFPCASLI